jgi:hypothetical protein
MSCVCFTGGTKGTYPFTSLGSRAKDIWQSCSSVCL